MHMGVGVGLVVHFYVSVSLPLVCFVLHGGQIF